MSKETNNASRSIFLPLLTLLFIGLKLTGHIDWSWLWVLSPLWLPLSAALAVALVIALIKSR